MFDRCTFLTMHASKFMWTGCVLSIFVLYYTNYFCIVLGNVCTLLAIKKKVSVEVIKNNHNKFNILVHVFW